MRKYIKSAIQILVPILALGLFVVIMLSGNYLKGSRSEKDDFIKYMKIVLDEVKNENWDSAFTNTESMENAWKIVVKRIQFSAERNEINDISVNLARLKGALSARDKSDALVELSEINEHWDNIGR